MATTNKYGSGISLPELMVPTQSSTIFTAQENSLYLPGVIVPMVSVPAGSDSVKIAKLESVTAQFLNRTEVDPGVDFTPLLPGASVTQINLDLIAARTVLRDLGGVDSADMGRVMGNAIAAKVDTLVSTALAGLAQQESLGVNLLDEMYKAIGTIRAAGETGPLNCVVSAAAYAGFMEKIGSASFAAADVQNAAMRSGFIGVIAGVPCYTSAYLNDTTTSLTATKFAVFSNDALRIAMQGGVNVEAERRASAVGQDIVASVAFGVAVTDATRGVIVIDAV